MMKSNTTAAYVFMLLVMAVDAITKQLALATIPAFTRVPVTDFFNLVLVWNEGVSFGMLQHGHEAAPYLLSVLALAVCLWLHRWLLKAETRGIALALGLIIGGALGNVIDRLLYGAVVDFLDFHVAGHHWPAFNVADSAICIGVIMLLLGGRHKSA